MAKLKHMESTAALLGLSRSQLEELAHSYGEPEYRGRQVFHWIYRKHAESFEGMQNLPARLRSLLTEHHTIGTIPPVHVNESEDGTRKYLFPTQHGGFVEAALIPESSRTTLCLSTQVGCRRSCTFCQTARQGFQGNLSAGEIINQYHSVPEWEAITNIVYMGMGEPLDNFDGAMASLGLFTDPNGYALPPRRLTLSTVGIHPELRDFLEHPNAEGVSLAVSLHSPFPEERRRIMPVENANPIEETLRLIRTGREDRNRRVSFEYTMFAGVNDTTAHVDGIAKLLNGLSVRINLIPYHELDGTNLRPTPPEEIDAFAEKLREKGFRTSVRHSRGQDINAACGMLWTRHVENRGDAPVRVPSVSLEP
ncbi:MAG: 23S rRNA (adenine(2503)-C(2))-methyltransferase RlmN [Alkalispirochaeta sp.]